ncbi:MAG: PAS domain S-box protein [Acidobacteria bacterium]|nr:PAS domain S-box protein [Acidobacteriota bacterium]
MSGRTPPDGPRRAPDDNASAYLAAIVASSDDAIIAKDLNGIIQSCNASAERLFGYPAEELVGRPVRILIPQDRQTEEDEILARIRRGDRVEHFETVRRRKDGQPIDISLTVSPVRDALGQIIGVSKIARDITERKRAAAELAAQEERFRVTLESIGDAVIATDVDGRVVFMNPVAERLTGWRLDDALGQTCEQVFRIIREDSREEDASPVRRVLAEGTTVGLSNHTLLIARDGIERPIDDSGAPIRDSDGRIVGVVLVFRDVSERRRIELERQSAASERERLLEAERLARSEAEKASRVKDEFVAMVSHELRTPLNAILGWTQLMSQDSADPSVIERGLDVVARNTRMQAQLIADLLDISRIATGKLQLETRRVDLAAILREAIDTVEPEAEVKDIEIVQHLGEAIAPITGDPARLQQVVWNLLSNAIKFTPSGGRVTATLSQRDGRIELVVTDTGVGVAPDVLPHVFERFQQADRSITRRFGGLGLGLSIVKHLVDLHGGSVRAESPGPGRGATFTLTFPIAAASPAGAATGLEIPVAPTGHLVSLEGLSILVVEDEPDTREFLARLLGNHGATVATASTASEALARFHAARPHVVVSDIGLPDVDGYDLIRTIREQTTGDDVLAIALTAYARSEDRARALGAGFQHHLSKPIDVAELIAALSRFVTTAAPGASPAHD